VEATYIEFVEEIDQSSADQH